jgi:hypothetical protein
LGCIFPFFYTTAVGENLQNDVTEKSMFQSISKMGRISNYSLFSSGVHHGATSVASGEKIYLTIFRASRSEAIGLAVAILVA